MDERPLQFPFPLGISPTSSSKSEIVTLYPCFHSHWVSRRLGIVLGILALVESPIPIGYLVDWLYGFLIHSYHATVANSHWVSRRLFQYTHIARVDDSFHSHWVSRRLYSKTIGLLKNPTFPFPLGISSTKTTEEK